MSRSATYRVLVTVMALLGMAAPRAAAAEGDVVLDAGRYRLRVEPKGLRFSFERPDGTPWVAAHAESGVQIGRGDGGKLSGVTEVVESQVDGTTATFRVRTADFIAATVTFAAGPRSAKVSVKPDDDGTYTIAARTGPLSPGYGLSDHGGSGRDTTDVTGFVNDDYHASTGQRSSRLVSNFVLFPRHDFAAVNIEPWRKMVRLTASESAHGSRGVREMAAMVYFLGTPREIYAEFLRVRNDHGYTFHRPKYEFFGVGWEAWGALAWDTNERTVTDNVDRYLAAGYPLSWMVVGSGFWPRHEERFHATTSFGMWDPKLYPDPKGLIDRYRSRGLKFFVGLRISFITDGPFAEEGVRNGYFLKDEDGRARVFNIAFPKSPCYLLDARNPEALRWYLNLCEKWLEFGVDGFKEDLFGYRKYTFRDDKIDPVNDALMRKGVFVMGRNGYLGSPADLHRYEDFNFNQDQDRGPINGLAFAYSGFPYVYPDIIGGTQTVKTFPKPGDPRLDLYLMRYAQYAALNPSMSVGYGPWNSPNPDVNRVMLEACKLHARLHPYIYSAALDAFRDGYPHPHTPLPVAFPDDENVYGRENNKVRGYQWLIGPSLMATPLYGDDYATAETRDVYLPTGTWIDYDTGERYHGPTTLNGFKLPVGKTPLFVGGPGVVIEQEDGRLHARVYPVASKAEYRFVSKDDKETTIRVDVPDWGKAEGVRVRAADGDADVKHEIRRHAVDFVIESGKSYAVSGR